MIAYARLWPYNGHLEAICMIIKSNVKSHIKKNVKSYIYCSKCRVVIIWHVGLVFGVWFWEALGMHSLCTAGASCEGVSTAG